MIETRCVAGNRSRSSAMRAAPDASSTADDASSRNSHAGARINARASARLCCSPPEGRSAQSSTASSWSASRPRATAASAALTSRSATPAGQAGYTTARRNVPGGMYGRCERNMQRVGGAMLLRAKGPMPASTRNNVDFPVPEGPSHGDGIARRHDEVILFEQQASNGGLILLIQAPYGGTRRSAQ